MREEGDIEEREHTLCRGEGRGGEGGREREECDEADCVKPVY